ncbi:hypothetical protein GVAV_001721 [Gurleya vavrai]
MIRFIALFKNHQNIIISGLKTLKVLDNKKQIYNILFERHFANFLSSVCRENNIDTNTFQNDINENILNKSIMENVKLIISLDIDNYCSIIANNNFIFQNYAGISDEVLHGKTTSNYLMTIFQRYATLYLSEENIEKLFKIFCIKTIQRHQYLQENIENKFIIFFITNYEIQNNIKKFRIYEFRYYEELFLVLDKVKKYSTNEFIIFDLLETISIIDNIFTLHGITDFNVTTHMNYFLKKQEKIIELSFQIKKLNSLRKKYNVTKHKYKLEKSTKNDSFDRFHTNNKKQKKFYEQKNVYIHMKENINIIFVSNHKRESFSKFLKVINHTYLSEYFFFSIFLKNFDLKIEYKKVKEFYYQEGLTKNENYDYGCIIYFLIYHGIKEYFDKVFNIYMDTNSSHPCFEIGFVKYAKFISGVEKNTIKKVYDVLITKKELKMKIGSFFNVNNKKDYSLKSTLYEEIDSNLIFSSEEIDLIDKILYYAIKYSFYSLIDSSKNDKNLKFQIYDQIELFSILNFHHLINTRFKNIDKKMFNSSILSLQNQIHEIFKTPDKKFLTDTSICYTIFFDEKSNLTLHQDRIILHKKLLSLIQLEIETLEYIKFIILSENNFESLKIYIHLVIINNLANYDFTELTFHDEEIIKYHNFVKNVINNANLLRDYFKTYVTNLKLYQIDLIIL